MCDIKSCSNCKNRKFYFGDSFDYCMDYEMSDDTKKTAANCSRYKKEEKNEDEEEYCPSSSAGDYSPSCPWNAPGMSVSDFI